MPLLLEMQERQLTAQLFQQANLNLFMDKLADERREVLQKYVKDDNALVRLLALSTIGRRHHHLEADLIDRLTDPVPAVRKMAHKALASVARGTDFGPIPGASQAGIARSVEKWRQWLALQQDQSATASASSGASAASTRKVEPLEIVQLVLDHSDRELQTTPVEVTRLSDELVKAQGNEQMSVLARLRDAKGSDHTAALALAIPRLSGTVQSQARDALEQRLTRMLAVTLRDKLQDDNVEVRRAAASACGRKGAKEHVPDLLQLLDDPEVAVIQAARRALKDLTGQDFGPEKGADRRARASAVDAWHKWCKDHADSQK